MRHIGRGDFSQQLQRDRRIERLCAREQREFFAAEPRRADFAACMRAQQMRDRLQHCVADIVAEAVVDRLEAVDVDNHQPHRRAARGEAFETFEQRAAIGQPGQRVAARQFARTVPRLDKAEQQALVTHHHHQLEPRRDQDGQCEHAVHQLAGSQQHHCHRAHRHQQHGHSDAADRHQAIAGNQRAQRHDGGVVEPYPDRRAGPAGDAPDAPHRGGQQADLPHRIDYRARFAYVGGLVDRPADAHQRGHAECQHQQRGAVGDHRPRAGTRTIDADGQAEYETDEQQPRLAAHVIGGEQGEFVAQMRGNIGPQQPGEEASPCHAERTNAAFANSAFTTSLLNAASHLSIAAQALLTCLAPAARREAAC